MNDELWDASKDDLVHYGGDIFPKLFRSAEGAGEKVFHFLSGMISKPWLRKCCTNGISPSTPATFPTR